MYVFPTLICSLYIFSPILDHLWLVPEKLTHSNCNPTAIYIEKYVLYTKLLGGMLWFGVSEPLNVRRCSLELHSVSVKCLILALMTVQWSKRTLPKAWRKPAVSYPQGIVRLKHTEFHTELARPAGTERYWFSNWVEKGGRKCSIQTRERERRGRHVRRAAHVWGNIWTWLRILWVSSTAFSPSGFTLLVSVYCENINKDSNYNPYLFVFGGLVWKRLLSSLTRRGGSEAKHITKTKHYASWQRQLQHPDSV